MEMNWTDLLKETTASGVVVLVVLAVMSVVAVSIAAAKWLRLRKMAHETRAFSPRFSAALERDEVNRAIALSRDYPESHLARVLGAALRGAAGMLARKQIDRAVDVAERAMEREQILLASNLRNGLGTIATIGATAPFVGLLGTVVGITNSFTGMAAAGGGGIEAVAGGIGETLVATASGLLVAIPAVWLYNHFITRLERLFSEVAYAGQELVEWIQQRELLPAPGPEGPGVPGGEQVAGRDERAATMPA
jgi:biopolymer transport protein ExbB